jgi:hypothetical protein
MMLQNDEPVIATLRPSPTTCELAKLSVIGASSATDEQIALDSKTGVDAPR